MASNIGGRSVSRRNFILAAGATGVAGLAGCTANENGNGDDDGNTTGGGNGDESISGEIVITGSSTVYPVSVAIAEEFEAENPDVTISVESTGSGGGFENHFCPGNSDINGASRAITDDEVSNCESNGVTPAEFEIAGDALTVAVNNEADWVDCMTFDELAQIWQPNGAETWADVNPDWPDEPFELFGAASTSGTFDWFTENVIGEAGSHRDDYEATEEDNLIVQGVEGNPYAMGYFGFAYYNENQDRIKGLEVDGGDGCAAPNLENAQDGSYPMSRPLYIYPSEEAIQEKPQVRAFMQYYLEQAGSDLVSEIGYVPSGESLQEENLSKLEEISG
ncbi:phosphate ABC transporter substrate-binding protein PstS family protein [Haloferacaceae archaeon DSL9]